MTSVERDRAIEELLLQAQVERFFAHETELLDERRFDEWLALLDDAVAYRMPLARNVSFDRLEDEYTGPNGEAAWFDEGKAILEKRVRQIQSGDHWAEEPRSRTTHLVANVRIEGVSGDEVTVKSRFVVCVCRQEHDADVFIGKRVDVLSRAANALKILRRTIYLDQGVLLSRNLTTFF